MASASSSTPHPSSSTKPKPRKSKPKQPPLAPQPKPEPPLFKYPPFPLVPPNAEIISFSQFKEYGIQLHGLPSGREDEPVDIEVDGLGIPTIALKVRHETDNCKTYTRGRDRPEDLNQKKAKSSLKEPVVAEPPPKKKDPIERAMELRKQRASLFSNKEWYDQWAEGEATRGALVYDKNLTIVNRIHYAANDFRKGRVWPLSSSGLGYLWDQFRLFAGLLGQPPVWYRTDLQQDPDDVVDEIEGDDEASFEKGATSKADDQKKEKSVFDDDLYDDDSENDEPAPQTQPSNNVEETPESSRGPQWKRIPPRTPYALHNIVPIALSSQSQVKTLLSIAYVRKYQKLESFIYAPDTSTRIFLSWYLHHQGFVFSPGHLANLPRLVLFFLEFLVRTKTVYESEQALKDAIEVTRKAITEVPAAGRMCRLLPDKVGVGCTLLWGRRWVEKDQPFESEDKTKEAKKEAEKRFEEELKNENVQVVSAEGILPPLKEFNGPGKPERFEDKVDESDDDPKAEISIQILSPTSPGASNSEEISTAFIEEVNEEQERAIMDETNDPKPAQKVTASAVQESSSTILTSTPESTTEPPVRTDRTSIIDEQASPNLEPNQSIPSRWDTVPDDPASSSQDKSRLDAWAPKVCQPLMELFGMTVLPLKYKCGVAERSMRRVREVIPAGTRSKEVGMERRWRGTEEDLVEKLTRVVLEPWLDWDDGGIAPAYRKPRVQIPQEGEERKRGETEKQIIVVLVEPRVGEQISVGMGLAGTWVQMVRVQDYRKEAGISTADLSEGGYGRGRGRGRGEPTSGGNQSRTDPIDETDPDPTASKDGVEDSEDGTAAERTPTQGGARRGWRGRGHGRGGYHHHHRQQGFEKEFVFWYVEDVFLAVPSFWMAGKADEPLKMPEGEEAEQDLELSDLED